MVPGTLKDSANARRYFRFVATAWITCLTVVSLQPDRISATRQGTAAHVAAHLFAFGVATILLTITRMTRSGERLGAVSLVVLAAAIEVGQWLMYRGTFEWWDIRTDTLGIAVAFFLVRAFGVLRFA
jgi:hypothetical protein